MEKCPHCNSDIPVDGLCPRCGDLHSVQSTSAGNSIPMKDQQIGPYKIVGLIAKGGMGRIYKAMHTTLFQYVALKVLTIEQTFRDPNVLDRFIQEAQLTAKLKHPNIATVYHAGQERGIYYIAMDLIQGKTLAEILAAQKLTVKETLQIVTEIARALHYAHGHEIIHRDVKPGNIMLDEHNVPFIMDFGLAKDTRLNLALTQAGSIVGSPYYMSPEHAQGKKLDHRSDIFSLGAVFYEMLTMEKPFDGRSSLEIIHKLGSANPVPIREIAPHVHKDIETICIKCLEKMPHKRYQTAAQIAEDIQSFLKGEVIRAKPAGLVYRAGKWMKRNKPVTAGFTVALCCLAATVIALIAIYRSHKEEQRSQKEREMSNLLLHSSRRMAGEIDNVWFHTLTDARVLAKSEELMAIMEQGLSSPRAYDKALKTLQMWAQTKGYLAIFLLDCSGICSISTDKTFENEDYSFRRYYQLAARGGQENIFYAIGTSQHTPGYYCAVPAYREGSLIGVCVIKFSLRPISQIMSPITIFKSEKIFLAEENGILIQSHEDDVPLLCLNQLDKTTLAEIVQSRQFLGKELAPLGLQFSSPPDLRKESLVKAVDRNRAVQLVVITPLPKFPYTIVRLFEYEELRRLCQNLSSY